MKLRLHFLTAAVLIGCGVAHAAGPELVLWRDPGKVEAIDFRIVAGGRGKAPVPPFTFIREEEGGTSPKVTVRDAAGAEWRAKGGLDVQAETFVTRLVSALGYYAEPTYFLAEGKIQGVGKLKRASGFIKEDGSFTYSAFELREATAKFVAGPGWRWDASPFQRTPELNGLRILVMLVSNWDNKDARDAHKGSNTSILEVRRGNRVRHQYFVNDWGQSMGKWGGLFGRAQWNCQEFARQTPDFVKPAENGQLKFDYSGQHSEDFKSPVGVADVRWLLRYLGRVTDAQIKTGLQASGATAEEQACFSRELRARIDQLRKVSAGLR